MEMLLRGVLLPRRSCSAKGGKTSQQRRPDVRAETEMDEFARALDVNETGGFELFDVVGQSGGRDGEGCACFRTPQGTCGAGDSFKELKTIGIGQRFQNRCAASA